jgi:hypothetical protein
MNGRLASKRRAIDDVFSDLPNDAERMASISKVKTTPGVRQVDAVRVGSRRQNCHEKSSRGGRIARCAGWRQVARPVGRFD